MKKRIYMVAIIFGMLLSTQNIMAKTYVVPPSSSTSSSVPVISDAAMEACVILYNDAKDLQREMNGMTVDQYSQSSVKNYNSKVNHHSQMINRFNRDCAGKQSQSAYEATQRLNKQSNQ